MLTSTFQDEEYSELVPDLSNFEHLIRKYKSIKEDKSLTVNIVTSPVSHLCLFMSPSLFMSVSIFVYLCLHRSDH